MYSILVFFIIVFILMWCYTIYVWITIKKKGIEDISWPHIYSNISNLFTSIGVLGTFTGIAFGLYYFQENDISNSIPSLLSGLKTAFTTSILGISFSIIAGRGSAYFQNVVEKKTGVKSSDELAALNNINKNIIQLTQEIKLNLKVK